MSLQTMYDEIERLENENSKLKDKTSELKQTLGSKEFEIIILENKVEELKDFINEVYQMLNKVGYLQGTFKTKYTIEYMKEKKSLWQ